MSDIWASKMSNIKHSAQLLSADFPNRKATNRRHIKKIRVVTMQAAEA